MLPGRSHTADQSSLCYKSEMPKTTEQLLLFKYVGREFTPLVELICSCVQTEGRAFENTCPRTARRVPFGKQGARSKRWDTADTLK